MDEGIQSEVDVVVVGAGVAGLYLLHRLRGAGLSSRVLESADDIGGTWYWNRYPGARCDIQSIEYSYSWDPELEQEWEWSERYATQPEILDYLDHVATKHDLRSGITFETRVETAEWDDEARRWHLRTDTGEEITCRHYVMATGCLSVPKDVDITGVERFRGPTYSTGRWPHEGVDFSGMRVAVIGTGSSGIQAIPLIAKEAAELTVFQRTPNFSMPALNGPIPPDTVAEVKARYPEFREELRWSLGGVEFEPGLDSIYTMSDEEIAERLERMWNGGELFAAAREFGDLTLNEDTNEIVAEFVRSKIREIVDDPETAEKLCPTTFPIGTKRPCIDTDYYPTFNLPHVRLVDLRQDPFRTITETGIETEHETFELDAIVYATGFDAMTGAIVAVDITGRDGVTLREKWVDGPSTYLGLTVPGFPNFFTITGPQSPSVFSNMMVSIEQHVDWVIDTITDLRDRGIDTIEPTPTAEAGWVRHTADGGDMTLLPKANSWYMGANVPGKPRVLFPYIAGVGFYRGICDEVRAKDYLGFELRSGDEVHVNDGVVCRLQPDVQQVLTVMAELGLPPLESMTAEAAKAFSVEMAAQAPAGPWVGDVVDGTYEGAAGPLPYRLYRPEGDGPFPVVAYFHGGGWVIGDHTSDDAFCRDQCRRSGSIIVSFDYRHGPEHRFPAAPDDAAAAVRWLGEHAGELGGRADGMVVMGWSAGANLAAVAARRLRDEGGPALAGQVLVTPVTDSDLSRPSYEEAGDEHILHRALMEWFWDHYADPADRGH
ncbi:MAG: alpha/beta hydrolase fold domain-containing protein, partial [Actinomycetota bacterium]